ncbi:MAG: hypothetical protein K2X29_12815, partial [Candidatus Obscuribacterales bacterium]|nr:hypothetical protein [Candidatus Obscuribacterales bacterium]
PGSVGKVDTPPEKPPIVLSPLAKLVRQVQSKIPAEVPAAAPSQDPSTGLSLSNETIEEVLTPKEIFVLNIFKNFILMMGVGAFMVIGILTLILVIAIFFGGGGLMLLRPLLR